MSAESGLVCGRFLLPSHPRWTRVYPGPKCPFEPVRSIQDQRVLTVALEDTFSGSKSPTYCADRRSLKEQLRATARGQF